MHVFDGVCPKCQSRIIDYPDYDFDIFTNKLSCPVSCLPCGYQFTIIYRCSLEAVGESNADLNTSQKDIERQGLVDDFIKAEASEAKRLCMDYGDYLQFKRIEREKGADISDYKIYMAYPRLSDATTDRWALERKGHKTIVRQCVKGYVLYWREAVAGTPDPCPLPAQTQTTSTEL